MKTGNSMEPRAGWALALGLVMVVLGMIAITAPILTSLAIELVLGWLFIVGGLLQIIYTFQQQQRGGSLFLNLLIGIVALAIGILVLTNPWAGVISLTLLIGVYFFLDGVFRVFLAFQLKPTATWGWLLFNGLLMIILGILIWSQWPFNAAWVLGLLVGIGLLINGLVAILYGITARNLGSD
jgi:uncharacterized membrane protein HdeD (DUF308 family)